MYDIIRKNEYFSWLNDGKYIDLNPRLKSMQDAFIYSHLSGRSGLKIAEIGGGNSRVLEKLAKDNECWNIDKFEGAGQGPTSIVQHSDVKIVKSYMGEFSAEVPSDYFDCVYSISVAEHVPHEDLGRFFLDIERILKPGGLTLHAIDCYLSDSIAKNAAWMSYADIVGRSCKDLVLISPVEIDEKLVFSSSMASDPDINMWKRNRLVPQLAEMRATSQCVSIKAGWMKKRGLNESEDDEIYVYQMGKVASASIDKTLKHAGYKTRHFHYIKGDFNSNNSSVSSIIGTERLDNQSRKIISLTRDPVARNISAFFQNLEVFCNADDVKDIERLRDIFFTKYNQDIPLNWFDSEFRASTGINVYDADFDKQQGYSIITSRGLEVLLVKSELSDESKVCALKSLLGNTCSINSIRKSNIATGKAYADTYKRFIENIVFPDEYLARMYDSKYVKHFYTDDEIKGFVERWRKS